MKLIDVEELVRIVENICDNLCPYLNKRRYEMCNECVFNKLLDALADAHYYNIPE